MQNLRFLSHDHPLQNVGLKEQLVRAQCEAVSLVFPSAWEFCSQVLADLESNVKAPQRLRDAPAESISDLDMAALHAFWEEIFVGSRMSPDVVINVTVAAAERTQLLRAFYSPQLVLDWAVDKVVEIISDLPREADDIRVGRNPGDVLDPYILAATQWMLCGGDSRRAIEATVAHKALMVLEGLLGHLHEEILGRMRGNVRVPEPRGEQASRLDLKHNPFPGADVVTPPLREGQPAKFHQIKSKTGSMNSSGGERLARQLVLLGNAYPNSELYSHSLVGNTLNGHRTMGVIHGVSQDIICTVGRSSFQILTGSTNGPELLLRVYQAAFRLGAARCEYDIMTASERIAAVFEAEASEESEGFLESILHHATYGDPQQQDSRTYRRRRR
jgi:hypothetical protein